MHFFHFKIDSSLQKKFLFFHCTVKLLLFAFFCLFTFSCDNNRFLSLQLIKGQRKVLRLTIYESRISLFVASSAFWCMFS